MDNSTERYRTVAPACKKTIVGARHVKTMWHLFDPIGVWHDMTYVINSADSWVNHEQKVNSNWLEIHQLLQQTTTTLWFHQTWQLEIHSKLAGFSWKITELNSVDFPLPWLITGGYLCSPEAVSSATTVRLSYRLDATRWIGMTGLYYCFNHYRL